MLHAMLWLALASSPAPWSDEIREAFRDSCNRVNAGKEGAAEFCVCMVRETQARITEEELLAYASPLPAETDEKVATLGAQAAAVCRKERQSNPADI